MACCCTYNSSLLYISNSFVFALVYKCWKCLVLSVVEVSKQLRALELPQRDMGIFVYVVCVSTPEAINN